MIYKSFTIDSALKMFGFDLLDETQNRKHQDLIKAVKAEPGATYYAPLTVDVIKQCFVFSNMTVVNEAPHSYQYEHLKYVEFLEFVCRMSILYNEHVPESESDEESSEEDSAEDKE